MLIALPSAHARAKVFISAVLLPVVVGAACGTAGRAIAVTPTGCWTDISTPAVGSASKLRGVEAVAANDVWAVGYYDVSFPRYPTLVEHWDGTAWSMVSSPDPPSPGVFPAPRAPPIR